MCYCLCINGLLNMQKFIDKISRLIDIGYNLAMSFIVFIPILVVVYFLLVILF